MIFFLLITWEPGIKCGIAQDTSFYLTPWIQEINLPSQYADIPNESFYLDELGHLFLGKENGLTIVNGERSIHLHMNGPVYVTGDGPDTLYYASENDLGYLFMDEQLGFHTKSVADRIPSVLRSFIPTGLVSLDGQLFMNTDHGVYSLRDGRTQYFPFQMAETHLYEIDNALYLVLEGQGILQWSGKEFQELVTQQEIGDEPVLLLSKENNSLQILTASNFEGIEQVTFIDHMGKDHVLVVTRNSGISILDHQGRLVNYLGNKKGLPERDILQVFTCEDHETWILAPHSLHKVTYPSPLDMLEIEASATGRILASRVSENRIILASSNGVYMADQKDLGTDRWILSALTPTRSTSYHLLSSADNYIYAAGSGNLVAIQGDHAEFLDEGTFTGILALNDHSLIAASEQGINLYSRSGEGWIETSIDPILTASHSFVKLQNELFFLCGNGVYRLSKDLDRVVPIPFHMDELLFKLIPMYGELYLVGINRVYRYEKNENTFLPLPWDLTAEVLSSADVIVSDESDGYWIVQHDGKYRSRVINNGGILSVSFN
ncbi:MAG: hypothetical protein KAT15_15410 [Bacteroidales bacterium]|nr:hypothetical protein [Bacteroidales bacterium]